MFQALKNRNVTLLFMGQVISIAGDMVLFVALPFWVYQLTGSAMATGFMFAALIVPQLLISPVAGVFVDRLDRKKLMIASDLLRAALMVCYLLVNSAEQVWLIYVLAFAESAISQFFRPAVMAVTPTLVKDEEELTRANALLGASWAIGQLAGPALGGVLVATLGPHGAALFDSASYLLSAGFVLLMHIPARAAIGTRLTGFGQTVSQIASELREGVLVVAERPLLRVVFASLAFLFLSQGIVNVLLVVVVNQVFHVGATEFGWLISAQGIGGVIGTVFVGALAARLQPRWMIVGGGLAAGAIFLVIMNQPSIYVAMGLIVFIGMAVVVFDVGLTTLLQIGSDDANRGRVSGLMHTAMAAAQLAAIAATSFLTAPLGIGMMLNIAGALFLLSGLVGLLAPRVSMTAPLAAAQPAE